MTARVDPAGAHELDRRGATPLWVQLLADLRRRLGAGEFSDAFPGELALVAEYRVSRHTVREALRRLREEGLVVAERGRPPRLASPDRDRPAAGHALQPVPVGRGDRAGAAQRGAHARRAGRRRRGGAAGPGGVDAAGAPGAAAVLRRRAAGDRPGVDARAAGRAAARRRLRAHRALRRVRRPLRDPGHRRPRAPARRGARRRRARAAGHRAGGGGVRDRPARPRGRPGRRVAAHAGARRPVQRDGPVLARGGLPDGRSPSCR